MAKYLGNSHRQHMEVHVYPQQSANCQLDEILPEYKVWFDSLAKAKAAGFDPCGWCLEGSTR